ncbi:uncharacterized protein LOC115414721 [Sphaeramia orbicularis]|uniref:uncharacterized protein LOC115414721 n=1 Tax=Sphaeramia orbicularis TaxID=375764 RepID=UPI00117C97FC|nr:uncharacterized protein LOC115414721 [Sphaeramia orbicularis]
MTSLLEEIRSISEDAACTLERADCSTDSEIKLLTRFDLNELLPGAEQFRVRKKVFEKIQNTPKPADVIAKELKSLLEDEDFRVALTGNGAPADNLNTLKELKGPVTQFQKFIDDHIRQLERLHENKDQEPIEDQLEVTNVPDSLSTISSSGASSQSGPRTDATGHKQKTHETGIPDKPHQTTGNVQTYTLVTVMNKTIITGKTLDAHKDVLKQVEKHFVQDKDSFRLQLEEKEDVNNCKIIIVFCPVVSRVGTDVESAMRVVPDDKDVILVLMHHAREAKASWNLRTWSRPKHVVLDVNVFFHDTVCGLLNCEENNVAVSEIQRKLLDYGSSREKRQISPNVSSRSFSSFFGSLPSLFPNRADK